MIETLKELDIEVFKLIHIQWKNFLLDILCPILRNKNNWILLYLFLFYQLYKQNDKKFIVKYLLVVITMVGISDFLCAHFLKEYFGRIRPCHNLLLANIVHPLVNCSDTYSFPSCHAMNHFALAIFFIRTSFGQYRWWLLSWAVIIGFSQVYVGVHYPMDIAVGALFGTLIGVAFVALFNKFVIMNFES